MNDQPSISMGCSGGNMANYICGLCNWNEDEIIYLCSKLRASLFIQNWSSLPMINLFQAVINGGFYKFGTGLDNIIDVKQWERLRKSNCEFLTGTFDMNISKLVIHSNKKIDESILSLPSQQYPLQNIGHSFADHDHKMLQDIILASAAIPALLPGRVIGDHLHVDGGIGMASPFNSVMTQIYQQLKKNTGPHLMLCNIPMESNDTILPRNISYLSTIFDRCLDAVESSITQGILNEVTSAVSFCSNCCGGKCSYMTTQDDKFNISKLQNLLNNPKTLVLIIPINFPSPLPGVSIRYSNSEKILKEIQSGLATIHFAILYGVMI